MMAADVMLVKPLENVVLASHCTMGVGGPARYFVEAQDERAVCGALEWAQARNVGVYLLGGGSNLVVADEGVSGLVIKIDLRGVAARSRTGTVEVNAAAGESWDALVRFTVERGWAGLECLSGIPGLVGATPIQNVGAYGQEVSQTLTHVRAVDRRSGQVVTLDPDECGFSYRDSLFRSREPGRYVILAVGYRLAPGGAPAIRYGELEAHVARRGLRAPSLADIRQSVIDIRRSKSMVLDPDDENRRSCGSFFLNPLVSADELRDIEARVRADGGMPRWPEPDGRVKLSAAWLIQRAGFGQGHREGPVGLSTRHTLAIVCHRDARAADVVAFARRLRARVQECFGVRLRPEPVFWGPREFE